MTTRRSSAGAMPRGGLAVRLRNILTRAGRPVFPALVALILLAPALAQFPPAGMDEFESSAIITVDLTTSGGPEMTLTVIGPTRIDRSDPVDAGDGRHVIETEILSMELRGRGALGDVTVRESPAQQSSGVIIQQTAGQDFPAYSFFDVFAEVTTDVGVFVNREPIRLQAVIDEIPPFQAMYIPDSTFVGVDLFNAAGVRVGVLRHASHFVGQAPSFSVAPGGPSGLFPATLFDVPTAPAILSGNLGLAGGDDVDGLSYGVDYIAPVFEARFSVDERADGLPGTAVFRESGKIPPQAHGDEFRVSSPPASGNLNTQVLDENGDTAPRFPLLVSDDVDALTEPPTSFVDPNGDGIPEFPVYLSLGAGSPSLAGLGAGPADILRTIGGAAPTVLFTAADLGLQAGDDIDAFCYDDRRQQVLFSLTPGSPTLGPGQGPATLFLVRNPPIVAPPPEFAFPNSLGLEDDDNLNALKCVLPEVDHFPQSVAVAVVNSAEVVLRGPITVHVGVGPGGDTGRNPAKETRPVDLVPMEVVQMDLTAESLLGPLQVTVRPDDQRPFQGSVGFLQETANLTDGVLDVPPFSPEGAVEGLVSLFFQIQVGQLVLHNEEPLQAFGLFGHKPPLFGEQFTSPSQVELFSEEGLPSGIQLEAFSMVPNALGPLPVLNAGGTVNSGDFRLGSSPDSINSSFGVNFSDRVELAATVPLPTKLAGVSLRVKDSAGTEQSPGLFVVTPNQVNWALSGDTAPGLAQLTLTREDDSKGPLLIDTFTSTRTFLVVPVSPSIFTANASGQGLPAANSIRVLPDATQIIERVTAQPISLGDDGDLLFLSLFMTGIRAAIPAAPLTPDLSKGAPPAQVTATVGGQAVGVIVAASPQFVAVDQANLGPIPRSLMGSGEVDVSLTVGGIQSNIVTVNIQ